MIATSVIKLELETLDVESFEIDYSHGGVLVMESDPDPETLGVDSRAAGCTEPIRVCSGTGWTIDWECETQLVDCAPGTGPSGP